MVRLSTMGRHGSGNWLYCFAKQLGHSSAIEAELWGLLEDLTVAREHGGRKVIVTTNSQATISLLWKDIEDYHCLELLICCCKALISWDWTIKPEHTYRLGNWAVDKLTNWSLNQNTSLILLEATLEEVLQVLLEDIVGIAFPIFNNV